jgi:hypothetical protein
VLSSDVVHDQHHKPASSPQVAKPAGALAQHGCDVIVCGYVTVCSKDWL